MANSDQNTTDDEFKNHESSPEPVQTPGLFHVMNSYAKEFIFVLAVAFTAIAALQNGPLKTQKAQPAVPFFIEPTLVTDFYQGDLQNLRSLVLEKDVVMVMYYAPWDAKSIETKAEFENVAKFYHQEVFFAAINCWWPEGECSRNSKVTSYPVMAAYVHDVGIVHYNGPIVANYMIAFLDNILSPIYTLQHRGELLDLQAKHEGVLVGYFDFRNGNQPRGYSMFYSSSLYALTRDPNRSLGFAIITNPRVRVKLGIKSNIQLHLWNRTVAFEEKKVSPNEILSWAFEQLDRPSQWVTPPRTKSKLLSGIVGKSATLILFTPRNFLTQSPYNDLLWEVALDYHNCNASAHVTSLVHRIVLRRHMLQEAVTKLMDKCQSLFSDVHPNNGQNFNRDLTCCQTLKLKLKFSKTGYCSCRVCIHHVVDSIDSMKLTECENTLALILKTLELSSFLLDHRDTCQHVEGSYPVKFGSYNRLSLKCDNSELGKVQISVLNGDDLSIEEFSDVMDDHVLTMVRNMGRNECSRLKWALNYSEIQFPEFPLSDNVDWRVNFTGLGCRTNQTLQFITMDSGLFHSFAENLGIDVLNEYHQTAAIIIDSKHESSYYLDGKINKRTLVEFVKNYTTGSLDRFLRSVVHKLDNCAHQEGSFCLPELTTSTFMSYVLDNDTDVVLMYYAPWCAACSAVFHVFLGVANYFSNVDKVKFARISGDEHDLPWEYTVDKYPTILFFPARRKADSMEFPSHMQITPTNLLHFVLVNSQPKVRWVIAMRMCNRQCVAQNLARSSTEIRRLYRNYRIALNQLYFTRVLNTESKTKGKYKQFVKIRKGVVQSKRDPHAYSKYLVQRIRRTRNSISQAFHLLDLLHKKRDMYLKGTNTFLTTTEVPNPHHSLLPKVTVGSTDSTLNKAVRKDEL